MATAQNLLIQRLPRKERARFLGLCDEVTLRLSEVLCESGVDTKHAYFPVDGFISLITPLNGKPVLEVGMVGSEGMLGTQLVLGVTTAPLFALVQGSGTAWRVGAASLRKELTQSKPLRINLQRYVQVTMMQLAASAACLRFHDITQRLARWLLMTNDRAHTDKFRITHEFLAYMLGVRRVGITTAAVALQRGGLDRISPRRHHHPRPPAPRECRLFLLCRGQEVLLRRHGLGDVADWGMLRIGRRAIRRFSSSRCRPRR